MRSALSAPEPRTSTSRPLSVAVTWMSSGLSAGLSASAIAQAAGIAPSRPGRQHRAGVDGDDVMRARRGEADLQHIVLAAPRMQHGAPAALRRAHRSAARPARPARHAPSASDHQLALPQMIFGERPVLQRAAAALAEMLADRLRALVARPVDMHEVPPVGMAGDRLRPSRSRPAAHRARRPGPPACRRRRRRDGRGGRW